MAKHKSSDTASHLRRTESSDTLLWKPHTSF